MEKVDFKEVVKFVRFNILANVRSDTLGEFHNLPDDVKLSVYSESWRGIIDACNYISSALDIDKLQSNYSNEVE